MSDILSIIQEAICSDYEVKDRNVLKEESQKMFIDLKSKGKYLLYDFEQKNDNLFPFFSHAKDFSGLRGIADYVIIAEKKKTLFVIIVELKKGRKSPKKQIAVTEIFMDFVLKRIFKAKQNYKTEPEFRGIGISTIAQKNTSNKIYDKNGFTFFTGKTLKLDIYL